MKSSANTGHIVSSYDNELEKLRSMVKDMAKMVRDRFADLSQIVATKNYCQVENLVSRDKEVDNAEIKIDNFVVRIIALRQPVAADLRLVVAALKMASDLERIADCTANAAKHLVILGNANFHVCDLSLMNEIMNLVMTMLEKVMEIYLNPDLQQNRNIWLQDQEVDKLYSKIIQKILNDMSTDKENINVVSHVIFIAKNIERIGDHITNIAEMIHYIYTGEPFSLQ